MSPLRRLFHYFSLHKPALTLGALCVMASAGFSLLKPLIVGNAVNELAKAVTRGALVRYGLLGDSLATVSACSASAHAIAQAARMIQYGDADAVVTGGSEAALTPLSRAASRGGRGSWRARGRRKGAPQRRNRWSLRPRFMFTSITPIAPTKRSY